MLFLCWENGVLQMRNGIWSGNILKMKLVTVSWHKLCKPLDEGGLGHRSLTSLNNATNFKLCWERINSEQSWASMLRSKVIKGSKPICYHIFSSLWRNMKEEYNAIQMNSHWLLGTGEQINFGLIIGVVLLLPHL